MQANSYDLLLKIAVAASLAGTILINYLAQMKPFNGMTPGEVSDSLPNLFVPAGLAFSIWGVIYLMLSVFAVFQFGFSSQTPIESLLSTVRLMFIINMVSNMAWIFAWHYRHFALSLLLMGVNLVTLILINLEMDRFTLTGLENIVFRIPFRLYFGWVTVAAVANVTALLVDKNWNRLGQTEQAWTNIILVVAALIGTVTMLVRSDIAYGLVLIWAYLGILIKHQSPQGFAKKYPLVISTVIACLFVFAVSVALMIFKVL